jgi:hypothetical protein
LLEVIADQKHDAAAAEADDILRGKKEPPTEFNAGAHVKSPNTSAMQGFGEDRGLRHASKQSR